VKDSSRVLFDPLCLLCKATKELDHIFMNFLYANHVSLCFLLYFGLREFRCPSLIDWETSSLKPPMMLRYISNIFVMDFGMLVTKLVLKEEILKRWMLSKKFRISLKITKYLWMLWCHAKYFDHFPFYLESSSHIFLTIEHQYWW